MDAGKGDGEVGEEGVGVVADVEEDFWDGWGLEDALQCCSGCAGGRECCGMQGVDVDEVGVVCGQDEEGEDGDGAVAGELCAF